MSTDIVSHWPETIRAWDVGGAFSRLTKGECECAIEYLHAAETTIRQSLSVRAFTENSREWRARAQTAMAIKRRQRTKITERLHQIAREEKAASIAAREIANAERSRNFHAQFIQTAKAQLPEAVFESIARATEISIAATGVQP